MAEKTGFYFMFDEWPLVSQLSDAQIGRLIKAIVEYEMNGNIIEMPKLVGMAFFSIKARLDRFDALRAKRSEAGKMGGAPKGNQNAKKQDETPSKQPQKSKNKQNKQNKLPTPVPSPIPEPKPKPTPTPKKTDGAVGFDEFWAVYPRRVGKKDAVKVWGQIAPGRDLADQIVAGVERWKLSDQWTKDEGRFIPYPATYLRGERWNDEVQPGGSGGGGGDAQKNYDSDEDFLAGCGELGAGSG